MPSIKNKNILFGVLNWGLGHASRSIPIIQTLIRQNNRITIASDGLALQFMQYYFPTLPYIQLPNYKIKYGKHIIHSVLKAVLRYYWL